MKNSNDEMERRLRELNAVLPDESGFSERVMVRIRVDADSPHGKKDTRFWRLVMKGSLGIAASVVVGVAVWHFGVDTPRMAYGVEDLPQRMLELKSLHLKGLLYPPGGGEGKPVEMFAQRPGWLRINGMPTWTTENGKTTMLETTDTIVTPTERMEIDAEKKQVVVSPETEIDAQLRTEQMLQQNMAMLLGAGENFKKMGKEKIGEIDADVYESKVELQGNRSRVEVFVNPATGLPMRSAVYGTMGNKSEMLEVRFDTIEPDAVIPAGAFTFAAPADYHVVKAPADRGMNAQVNDAMFGVRFAIALDKKTMLVCWRMYNVKRPEEDLTFLEEKGNRLEIRGNGGVAYQERLLRADESEEGFHWRWSLMTTEHPASAWANAVSIMMQVHGGSSGDAFMPVTLPEKELAEVVEKAQRLTLPADGKPMTLQEIEATK